MVYFLEKYTLFFSFQYYIYIRELIQIMFPIYLKYKQHETYFKINSLQQFEEIRILGKYFNLTAHEAKILPDRVFIADLLEDKGNRLERITSHEFEDVLENCYRNKIEKVF